MLFRINIRRRKDRADSRLKMSEVQERQRKVSSQTDLSGPRGQQSVKARLSGASWNQMNKTHTTSILETNKQKQKQRA